MEELFSELMDKARCPSCRSAVVWGSADIHCVGCQATYPIMDGIPVMTRHDARTSEDEVLDEIMHKKEQQSFYDRHQVEEFEIGRPWIATRLYQWAMTEKFRRTTKALAPYLSGATALVVCGGSGMDAEFLARRGCHVVTTDLSAGASTRARQRMLRSGVPFVAMVADVESLPFENQAFDVVYVHDGLHHLDDPRIGLGEMLRVARHAVCVCEPASAMLTTLAIRAGIAEEIEEAGNRVIRFTTAELKECLERAGFLPVVAARFSLFYRHNPGRMSRWLSTPGVFEAATAVWQFIDPVIGRLGNKLVVQGVRMKQEAS